MDRLGMFLDPSWIESVPTWVDSNLASELSYLSKALISLGVILVHIVLVFGLFILFPLYLLGKLIFAKSTLSLDLNGLHHASADGQPYTPWRDVHGVDPDKLRWIRVQLKNGILLRLRVPKADRDWLVEAMRQLLRHHYGDLHGQMRGLTIDGRTTSTAARTAAPLGDEEQRTAFTAESGSGLGRTCSKSWRLQAGHFLLAPWNQMPTHCRISDILARTNRLE
jgi:hypothetical protein